MVKVRWLLVVCAWIAASLSAMADVDWEEYTGPTMQQAGGDRVVLAGQKVVFQVQNGVDYDLRIEGDDSVPVDTGIALEETDWEIDAGSPGGAENTSVFEWYAEHQDCTGVLVHAEAEDNEIRDL